MARQHERLYNTQKWRRRSKLQRQAHPMCQECESKGRMGIAAEHSHHVVEHHGDEFLFHFGKLKSLCHGCHLAIHGRALPSGFSKEIALDGWPVDPAHPVNKLRRA